MSVNTSTVKKLAYIFSPCVIAAIICALTFITMDHNGKNGYYLTFGLWLFVPYLIAMLILDLIIRAFLKGVKHKEGYIWLIEILLIVFILIAFRSSNV